MHYTTRKITTLQLFITDNSKGTPVTRFNNK